MIYSRHQKNDVRVSEWNRTFDAQMQIHGSYPFSAKEFQRIDAAQKVVEQHLSKGTDEDFKAAVARWIRCATPIDTIIDQMVFIDDLVVCCAELVERFDQPTHIRITRCKTFDGADLVIHLVDHPDSLLASQERADEAQDLSDRFVNQKGAPPRVQITEVHIHISELPTLASVVSALPDHRIDPDTLGKLGALKSTFGGVLEGFVAAPATALKEEFV